MRTILSTVSLAGAVASTALCADFQWQGQLAPGQLLEIQNIRGSIVATAASGNTATVTATKSAKTSDPNSVSIQAVTFAGGVVLCAIYPDAPGAKHPNTCNPPGKSTYLSANNNDVEVDFTVSVPLGVLLTGNTLTGDVHATGLTAEVDARALHGNITLSTAGFAQANTSHGAVNAQIGAADWKGAENFAARSGNLDLTIPSDANVEVEASAFFGAIMSDFPLTITTTVGGHFSMAHGPLGSGGRTLKLSTFSGNITLHKGPASGK